MRPRHPGAILCVAALLPPVPAAAATTQTFQVTAAVVSGCAISSAADTLWGTIDFGTASGAANAIIDANLSSGGGAGISIQCTPGVTATLSADSGDHATGGIRQMARTGQSGAATIPYQLYLDGASTPWSGGGVPFVFGVGATSRLLPIRGQATVARPLAAGAYTDTIRVTLSW